MRMEPLQHATDKEEHRASLHTHSWDKAVPESLGVGFRIYSLAYPDCAVPVLRSVPFWVLRLQQCPRGSHQEGETQEGAGRAERV